MYLTVMQDSSEPIHYRDPSVPIYVSRGDLKSLSNMSALCHWHEDIELLLPLHGYLTYNVNGTTVTVTEIADACGYSSASYFTEMFTKQKGCSPKVYRKTNWQEQMTTITAKSHPTDSPIISTHFSLIPLNF